MDLNLRGKVAVVTGASLGIGAATTQGIYRRSARRLPCWTSTKTVQSSWPVSWDLTSLFFRNAMSPACFTSSLGGDEKCCSGLWRD